MAKRVGQQFSNYRLLRLLGQGNFADVYLGEHIYDKSLVAIKILRTRLTDDLHESFINEAWTLKHLTHPNIVHIQGIGIVEDIPYLAMEYAPHGTLRNRHPSHTKVPLAMIVDYVKQITNGLQYAHDHKLIHRDMKPENLLIGQQSNILISDFGVAELAQSTRSLRTQDSFAGTISYMAPEQLQGKPRLASDQYALGIIVYEWLCGKRPFYGTTVELLSQHLSVPPSPLQEHDVEISSAIERVVLKALAKEPAQRFPSVQAFAAALEQASQDSQSVVNLDLAPPQPTSLQANTAESRPSISLVASAASSPISSPTFDETGTTIAASADSAAPSPVSFPNLDENASTIAGQIGSDAPLPISSAPNPVTLPIQPQADAAPSTPASSPTSSASQLPQSPASQDDSPIPSSPPPLDDDATPPSQPPQSSAQTQPLVSPQETSATSQPATSATRPPTQTLVEIHSLRKQYFTEMTRLRRQYFAEMTRLRRQFFAEIGYRVKQCIKGKALALIVLVLVAILGISADAIHSSVITSHKGTTHTPGATIVASAPATLHRSQALPSSCASTNWTLQISSQGPVKSTSFMTTTRCHNTVLVSFTQALRYPTAIRACTLLACEAWLHYMASDTPIVLLTNIPAGTSFYLESISNTPTTFTAHVRVFY